MTQKSPSENGPSNVSTPAGGSSGGPSGSADSATAKDGFKGVARELTGEVTHIAKDFADEAKKAAETKVGAGKDFAAEQLGSVADALRTTSKHLRASESPVSEYVERAATSVEGVSQYFKTRTLNQLINDMERYARREPAIFLGAAFFAGMLGGRFLKAATPAASPDNRQNGNRSNQPSGQGARALPAHNASADHRGQSQHQGQGSRERHEQGNKHQEQGSPRGDRSTSAGSERGSASSAKDSQPGSKGTSSGGGQSSKSDTSDRGGNGSGVS